MIKLQQFDILKFTTTRIKKSKHTINIDIKEARNNNEIVSVGDNQVFRVIRNIRGRNVVQSQIDMIYQEIKFLRKHKDSIENRNKLISLENKKDNLLFMPECISIVTENKKDYENINNGKFNFCVNGKKYVRLLCSSGNARNNVAVFIQEEIEGMVKHVLKNGIPEDLKIEHAKYNAYFALSMSATYQVSDVRFAVIDDCISFRKELVDWITENDIEDEIEEREVELEFNLFDGMGVCSIEQSRRWAEDLELDYIPSAFCIRNAFLKGMVCTFDIQKFARKISKKFKFKDIWGNAVDIRNIDLILTKSQLKMWKAYNSCEDYIKNCHKNGFTFGITKVSPKLDKTTTTLNYQFIQATNQTSKSIEKLCGTTVKWFNNIIGNDPTYFKLYMFGKMCEENIEQIYDKTDDILLKCVLLNDDLIDDVYIKKHVYKSINRKIKESYIGKVIVDGNYQVMISDPYAFMEHVFEMPVLGLLNRDEHYSNYWNERNVTTVAGMRAPLTWRSEVNILHLQKNDKTKLWYKYLNSGIVYNVHGNDCMLHSDSDFDFDILCTTNNENIVNTAYGGIPITYQKKLAEKKLISEDELYKSDLLAYNPIIGFITNTSSTMYVMLEEYEERSKEYSEIYKRLKLSRKEQGNTIDSAKGIIIKEFPKHWTNYIKIKDSMTEIEKKFYEFSNTLIVEKRPYFFRYLYSHYNDRYLREIRGYEEECYDKFRCSLSELLNKNSYTQNESEFLDKYKRFFYFIDNDATMNYLCHYMESKVKEIKINSLKQNDKIVEILISERFKLCEEKYEKIKLLYKEFILKKQNFNNKKNNKEEYRDKYANIEQICKEIKRKSFIISSNIQELSNMAVQLCYIEHKNYDKDFVWKVFGSGILENVKENKKEKIMLPVLNDNGNIEYLGKMYSNEEVDAVDI